MLNGYGNTLFEQPSLPNYKCCIIMWLRTVYVLLRVDAVQQIFREEGFRGLWSGTRASLVLATNPAIQFAVYETVKRYMRGANKEVRS